MTLLANDRIGGLELAREAPVREGLTYDAVPMVGRDHDVTAIRELLDRGRMVSVVGPGGLGKTRMAHLVGHLAEQPVVRLVELSGVGKPRFAPRFAPRDYRSI